jgi:hypothetical protein
MKRPRPISRLARPLPWLFVLALAAHAQDSTSAVEINGVLCGYVDTHVSAVEVEGKAYTLVEQRTFVMRSALGMSFNTEIEGTFRIDPETGRFVYSDMHLEQ